jgi:hypothetical protein
MNWLSPKTIAAKLDMHPKSLHRMIERGELPCVTFASGRRRVSEQALERLMRNLEKKSRNKQQPSTCSDEVGENGDSPSCLSAVQSGDHGRKSA